MLFRLGVELRHRYGCKAAVPALDLRPMSMLALQFISV